ncbi:unnamed protein product [Ambrosiozyma monospora]|uniref:Unnamed protein product n=1 Tax=Ambrosiozyma monospora TaxID=43982 RepID=A0A9W6YX44_AMBMO|nr:unnamed protein product [Ambrosiozyma monospora]
MVNNNIGNDGYVVNDNIKTHIETEEKKEIPKVEEEKKEDELTEEQLQEKLMQEKYKNRVEIPLENCLFCNKKHDTLEDNIDHMFKSHGLYLPEVKYLVDKSGLINYLSEKIGFGNVCLVCHYQGRNIESVRQHMLSKSHCKIPYETEDEKLEISNFYDFTSSYDQVEDGDGDADEWEDISGDEAGNSDEESDIPEDNLYVNSYQLHLPNGSVAGHRSLARYYRQNLRPERELSEGQGTVIAAETRHFVTQVDRKAVAEKKRAWAREEKVKDTNDRRAAKFINWQPHYRDQLLQ